MMMPGKFVEQLKKQLAGRERERQLPFAAADGAIRLAQSWRARRDHGQRRLCACDIESNPVQLQTESRVSRRRCEIPVRKIINALAKTPRDGEPIKFGEPPAGWQMRNHKPAAAYVMNGPASPNGAVTMARAIRCRYAEETPLPATARCHGRQNLSAARNWRARGNLCRARPPSVRECCSSLLVVVLSSARPSARGPRACFGGLRGGRDGGAFSAP